MLIRRTQRLARQYFKRPASPTSISQPQAGYTVKHLTGSHGLFAYSSKRLIYTPSQNEEHKKMYGPVLPVLEKSYNYLMSLPEDERPDFSRTLFICGEHLLDSSVSLFECYIKLGAKPENIYVIGKSYSNNDKVIEKLKLLNIQHVPNAEQDTLGVFAEGYDSDIIEMLKQISHRFKKASETDIDGVIVADDGGHVLAKIRSNKLLRERFRYIVGVEQTSSGIDVTTRMQYSVIELARSAVKRLFEPAMVAEKTTSILKQRLNAVAEGKLDKFKKLEPRKIDELSTYFKSKEGRRCGIVGMGNIGAAVLDSLIQMGYEEFILFDVDIPKAKKLAEQYQKQYPHLHIHYFHHISVVFSDADMIIGCTGKDITAEPGVMDAFTGMKTPKILLSCSSKDIEFLTLLLHIQTNRRNSTNPLDDILFQNGYKSPLLIFQGGMPINFNNSKVCVPNHLIQVIRGIKLMAAFQAYRMLQDLKAQRPLRCANYQLNPQLQKIVVEAFLEDQPDAEKYCAAQNREKLTDLRELGEYSSGEPYPMKLPESPDLGINRKRPGK